MNPRPGDPSEEEAQRDLEDSEGAHSQSVDPATNGDLVDAEESQEYADSENAEEQAVGDLAEDVQEDQEVQQEPEDNEMEHREAADGDTMIGVLPEDEEQEQDVTQEHGDIDIHAEEVGAATISGDLPAEANEEEPEQQGPGDAPEEAIQQELREHESADVQAGAETMRGEVGDVEHDQVVQQRAPEASGHLPAEEPKAEGEAPETSHTSRGLRSKGEETSERPLRATADAINPA
ncbi:sec31 [Symbiodinium necroappetens]|uniref:Sec31 protein n=1 Tax=Symbiodinium necroappetens TaxID=1628268 RepID=A0A812YZY0_9DINO|nr:sec31 [Symbiodinium necroappetens]